ncbi:DNA repair protein RadC [Pseudomonas oryzihabitans]|uniref:RadC family protein n=1 Tax=Pseudomonas oryzihabitans TaxID=47885 RepID=UPI0018D5DBC7|nr:DNA repair protein RadC [Pseudomonas oryzihabitans]MBH3329872.1 DNA repair protein RadC [Pseudomonas oryzihabitans]
MTNVHTLDSTSAIRAREDDIISEAKAILDQRLFARGRGLNSPDDVRNYLKLQLAPEPNEVFAVIFVDTRHRVIAFEIVQYGTIDAASISPRHVAQRCLRHNAAAVIVAHNHPSGDPEPSSNDYRLTERLRDALALLEIRMLDHFIVGKGQPLSMAETGRVTFSTSS